MESYTKKSLELHLFFGRIMKEHALFLRAGFTPADVSFSRKAEYYKNEFESLLSHAVSLGCAAGRNVLCSGEIVTEFTAEAEKQTQGFTGISINREITARELCLCDGCPEQTEGDIRRQVRMLNQKALSLLDGLISFKQCVLERVLECRMFTMNYPLLIEHILREANLYREYLELLERDGCLSDEVMQNTECFWNQIMMEHALFIRGLLDPTECELIRTANDFAAQYSALLDACCKAQERTVSSASCEVTEKFRDFKRTGTKGIQDCGIRSVILPLLADHVLREANHYLRLLNK